MDLSQCRSQRRDDIADVDGCKGDGVHEALHDHDRAAAADVVARLAQTVQDLALVEDRTLGRIEILGRAPAGGPQHSPAEGQYASGLGLDGEDDAVSERVVRIVALFALLQQTYIQQDLLVQPVHRRGLAEGPPVVRSEAQPEVLPGLASDPALLQVVACSSAPLPLPEPLPKEGARVGDGLVVGTQRILAPLPAPDFAYFDPAAGSDELHRVDEAHSLVFHEEGEDIARLARGKVVEEGLGGIHVERGGLLLLEGTQSAELPARLLELHELADHAHDVGARLDLGDHVVRYHVTESSPRLRRTLPRPDVPT